MEESNWRQATKHTDLAEAIAHAEGFGQPGAVPTRANNPGDMKPVHWTGPVTGAENIAVFSDVGTGWAALEHELDLIRARKSHVYTPSMTIREMAEHWTGTQRNEWAQNVCDYLSKHGRPATVDTPLKDVL